MFSQKGRADPLVEGDLDRGHDLQHALVRGTEDLHEGGGIAVVAAHEVGVLEAVDDTRDLTQPDDGAIRLRQDDQVLEVLLRVVLSECPDSYLLLRGVDAAGRQVERSAADGGRDVGERQTQCAKSVLLDLDRDLVGANSRRRHEGHFGKDREGILRPIGNLLERALTGVAMDGEADCARAVAELADLRPVRAHGEGLDLVDLRLDLVEGHLQIGAELERNRYDADALVGGGVDLVDAFDGLDRLLDLLDDRFLDLVRVGPGVGDLHLNRVQAELGKDLLHQVAQRKQTSDQQEHEQEVRCHPIAGHVRNRTLRRIRAAVGITPWGALEFALVRHRVSPDSVDTSTCMPFVATSIPLVTTASPSARSPSTKMSLPRR